MTAEGARCPDCGQPDHRSPEQVLLCQERVITGLREHVAELEASLGRAERENEAWRALVGRFRFHAPYQTLDTPPAWRAHAGDHRTEWQHLAYGNGPTPQAAAIDLAIKLGLIAGGKTNG